MPNSAKVFLVEDDILEVPQVKYFLGKAGHEVIAEASSLNEALALIPRLIEKGVNVAIVDGNLTPGDNSGNDGQTVAREIHRQAPGIKVVAYSSRRYEYGDIFIAKGLTVEAMREFANAVTAL